MLFKSPLISQASGSIAGNTFSRNRGGMYIRARATPTNPNTAAQQTVRAALAQMAQRWTNQLDAMEREAWKVYADNVTVLNPLGDAIHLTGQQMYIRTNTVADQVGAALIDAAPTTFNLGDFTLPTVNAISASADQVSLAFDDTDDWVDEADSYLVVYYSAPKSAGISYFKGPYIFTHAEEGDVTTPPTTPLSIDLLNDYTAGQQGFGRCRVLRADGRLSDQKFLAGAIAA